MIEALNVTKEYRSEGRVHRAVSDVSFSVARGEKLAVLGRNGAGRTTTLRALLGLVGSRSGSVLIHGEEAIALPPHRIGELVFRHPKGRMTYYHRMPEATDQAYRGGWFHSGDLAEYDEDGFFYDAIHLPNGQQHYLKVRSIVGLIPLFAVETLEPELLDRLPGFKRRLEWFIDNRPDLVGNVACMRTRGKGERRLLSIVGRDQLRRVLQFMLDENEFLSPYGIRALSRYHKEHPYTLAVNGMEYRVNYEPAESSTGLFGGNSNWRGPIWFPMNYLLVESLQKFHHYLGDDFKVEFPSRSGNMVTLSEVAAELSRRLSKIFLRDDKGERPVYRDIPKFQTDPNWNDLILFHEYFHGDTGRGVGASHQTGWTGLVAKMLQQSGESSKRKRRERTEVAFTD